uniref:Uncharacterized protein n=1 Tax=Zea mays TaxID=4577 RepID=C4J439_MAIZE|nr:unknown [Zea mays]ACR36529.1 unknown [Zea mays]
MKNVLVTPTAQVTPSSLLSSVIPALLNRRALYWTTESLPEACWKKWSPTADSSMRRTAGVGDRMSCFQTCVSLLPPSRPLLGTATTSPSRSLGIPAAALMSASRAAASSGVAEVLSSTTLASARRPFRTSHRGDSGMQNTSSASSADGTAPMASMTRQPRWSGRRANAKLDT